MSRLIDLGRLPYRDALALMRDAHARVASGEQPDTWLVVEHHPVITLGRNANRHNLRVSPEYLAARGVDLVEVERGGDATYHGPGQLVVYPILRLARFREIVPLVSALEGAAIAALATYAISARGRREHRGVYVGARAICAIGLAVKQMTSLHGLALNVSTALDYDRFITPCGTPQFGITSIAQELGRPVTLGDARDALFAALRESFDVPADAERADTFAHLANGYAS